MAGYSLRNTLVCHKQKLLYHTSSRQLLAYRDSDGVLLIAILKLVFQFIAHLRKEAIRFSALIECLVQLVERVNVFVDLWLILII